jgi:DNA invertase Pin-like site-specific DNA recombinase
MIISENIKTWAKKHSLQETLHLLSTGETVYFIQEDMRTTDSMAPTVLTAAYMYFEVERERRSMIASAVYKRKAAAGEYTPRDYFGFEPGTFVPSADRKYIVEMFLEASQGVEPDEIAEWLNDCGLTTVRGNLFTSRSVRAILSNPVYCGDVMFRSAGRTVRDHHEGLVSRELWERANAADQETTEQVKVA